VRVVSARAGWLPTRLTLPGCGQPVMLKNVQTAGKTGAKQAHRNKPRPSSQYRRRSLLQLSLQQFDLSGKRAVGSHQILDFADGMQDSGMVSAAESPADFR